MAICFSPAAAKSDCPQVTHWVPLSAMKNMRSLRLPALALLLLAGYAWLVEPSRLAVRRVVIKDSLLARAWPGLSVVHLSDTHIERLGDRESRLLGVIKELSPDLIVLSGDFNQWHADPGPAQQFLAQLSAPLGVYGVLGDADQVVSSSKGCAYCHPDGRYHERLASPVLLQNEWRGIAFGGGTIDIAGVDLEEETGGKWLRQLRDKASRDHRPLLIVSHFSKRWREAPLDAHSLWLSGDTHGGQVWMPDWVWRLMPYKPDPEHMGGVYGNGQGGWLVVNRGVGMTSRFPFRLGVLPELLVITFAESQGEEGGR